MKKLGIILAVTFIVALVITRIIINTQKEKEPKDTSITKTTESILSEVKAIKTEPQEEKVVEIKIPVKEVKAKVEEVKTEVLQVVKAEPKVEIQKMDLTPKRRINYKDFGSATMNTEAWKALNENDPGAAIVYTKKVIEMYEGEAKKMQTSLSEYAWESKEKIFSYWALNDVGTAYFIQGEAYKKAGYIKEAKEAYSKVVNDFFYAQTWDTRGWFWKPAEAAEKEIE